MRSKRSITFLIVVIFLAGAGLYVYSLLNSAVETPSFIAVKNRYKTSEALLFDRHGEIIHQMRVDFGERRLAWIQLESVSPLLIEAVIQSEDKRFYYHTGVDWVALGGAAIEGGSRGASTITMQLASILDKSLRPGRGRRTVGLKWRQIRSALSIEKTWSKVEILEAYLNLVSFRGELQGISAASWGLFGKEPNGLNVPESLILAALIRSPNAVPEDVIRRAALLGTSLKVRTDRREIESLAYQILTRPYTIRRKENLAPHVALMLLGRDVLSVISSVDAGLQRFAVETLERYIREIQNQNVSEGAILVVDNRTGEVLAYVANRGGMSSSPYVDGIQAKRQAGSTLKPFLYALAFEKRILTAASLIKDGPLDVSTERGLYIPNNYDGQFRGNVTARTALASSLNVPAVKTGMLVGSGLFAGRLKELGIGEMEGSEFYGPSIALGTVDVSLWELVNAYRTLANMGVWGPLILTPGTKGGKSYRVYSKESVFLVSDILSDREARSTTFGLENPLSTKFWTAVKTGTSKDMRDNWCLGYSDRFTVGVWVGNFSNEPMWNVSGVSGAAPVWIEIMNYLHNNIKSVPPLPPSNVISKEIFLEDSGNKKREWFIKGTEPEIVFRAAAPMPKILYPSSGTIIAFDPDIPMEYQKIFFETNLENERAKWLLNGMQLGSSSIMPWIPVRGTYELALVDKDDHVLDRITFEVR